MCELTLTLLVDAWNHGLVYDDHNILKAFTHTRRYTIRLLFLPLFLFRFVGFAISRKTLTHAQAVIIPLVMTL